ncbi:hypothetical protein UAY_00901 [Enterococcus moraviensis ATCC BAA-383]|uniref:Fungal lipase-like domain-containing protein n=1 Tax=Enterococcus moraviensis ATCC BAA-383 TaxID=1158609 RepID=R2TCA5_9ENTE|nr:hypothetical protein [Enterococcus moraviensis]EOI02654.1 hypothetical protein UAY_00901 [Enterococcus moraviensis ATCC BAA-383]EOT73969.1 hypothetical protein I586_00965 [Enterococcus moraviensis ATCC BAA-383]OJG66117.1 hypothetical protein RV09_GL000966 [Enterococcus moraviensis]
MTNNYSDEQRVDIAKEEYAEYKEGQPAMIDEGATTIGYVSKVVNNKETGEQAYIITDVELPNNPTPEQAASVNNVTVIYRGSSEPFKEDDWMKDWLDNDIPIGKQILTNDFTGPTLQLKSSAKTLDAQMELYENARFDIYGHSLGSMNGQYALAASKYPERIGGAYLYQGPNIYGLLTKEQKLQADKLRDQIFNYVDFKDVIPIGYDLKGIGIVIPVKSKEDVGMIDRHMWGGYQYDSNGNLSVPEGKMIAIRTAQTKIFIKDQLGTLGKLAAKLRASGGGLSSSEEIFLDSQCVLAIANGVYQLVQQAIQDLAKEYDTQITEIEELWDDTLEIARNIGSHLNDSEMIEALSAGGCTKQTLVTQPVTDLKDKFSEIKSIGADYVSLVDQIKAGVEEQLAADQDLARQVANL